ncbi:Pol polyprotein [Plakobranchus ocellatus]|uniref:Pol polyprotein n=1 Tax=Plakobranchus ocellatus TaxID=259542 RepID=A0AAV4C0Y5_9GAST|nr:Pol polyprotein [Plakobranchus ocellatus]
MSSRRLLCYVCNGVGLLARQCLGGPVGSQRTVRTNPSVNSPGTISVCSYCLKPGRARQACFKLRNRTSRAGLTASILPHYCLAAESSFNKDVVNVATRAQSKHATTEVPAGPQEILSKSPCTPAAKTVTSDDSRLYPSEEEILSLYSDFAERQRADPTHTSCFGRFDKDPIRGISLGFPLEIHLDNGPQFISSGLKELNFKHIFSTPYHPQTNGVVERFHGTLKNMLRKLSYECPTCWDKYFDATLYAYRSQVHSATGFSPFYLLFGRAPRCPMAMLHDLYTRQNVSVDTYFQYHYIIDLHNKIKTSCRIAQDSASEVAEANRQRHEPKSRLKVFEPGDLVMILLPQSNNKQVLQLQGPFERNATDILPPQPTHDELSDVELALKFSKGITFAQPEGFAYVSAVTEDPSSVRDTLLSPSTSDIKSKVRINPHQEEIIQCN